jgi:nucleotide-binding universal stress UspA family protein
VNCLVYVDPSSRGEWALRLAALVAPSASKLTLLATEEDAARDPQLFSKARAALGSAPVEERRAAGPAEVAIPREAVQGDYALVIVPPAGRSALARMLKGSRVASVVKSVRAQVLVARRPPAKLARLLAAVPGGPAAPVVVAAALEMERLLGATATFLHVASEVALPYAPAHGTSGPPPSDARAEARRAVEAVGRSLVIREGLVVEEILEELESGAHDLLVAGASASESAWGREDVTERILLRCPTSMLICRP